MRQFFFVFDNDDEDNQSSLFTYNQRTVSDSKSENDKTSVENENT